MHYDDYHDRFSVGVIVTIGAGTELDGNDSDCVFGLFGDCHGVRFDDRADRVDDAQRLIASAQGDDLTGDAGPNVILARGGADHVDSRGGDDAIDLVDGVQDRATCGAGADTVTADAIDVVDPSCDTVNVP